MKLGRSLTGLFLAITALAGSAFGGAAYERHEAAISTRVSASIVTTETASLDLGTATFPASLSFVASLTNGVGTNQADLHWSDTRTLSASATENLDFAGVLTNAFGQTLTFAKLRAIQITASCSNTNNVVVGGAGTNTLPLFNDPTDKIAIRPCHTLLIGGGGPNTTAGIIATVTAGTGDILLVANSGGTTGVTYSIEAVGLSS